MKCNEVRRALGPYLDSELDAKTSLEVEHHLGSCAECAGLFDAEKKFSQRISSALHKGERTPALWSAVELRIRPTQRVLSILRWPVAAAATVVLLAAVWISRDARPLDLAAAAEECHNAYVQKITSPEFNGPVPEWIARELGPQLDTAAFDYRPSAPGFSTEGARFCHVANVPTALILGHFEGVPVSLLVFKKSELVHFPRTKARLEAGGQVLCGRVGRYQFAARIVDDHVICAVAQVSHSTLENLVERVVRKT